MGSRYVCLSNLSDQEYLFIWLLNKNGQHPIKSKHLIGAWKCKEDHVNNKNKRKENDNVRQLILDGVVPALQLEEWKPIVFGYQF